MKIIKNKKGQGLIEYLIIVAIVAVGSMAVMRVVGSNLNRRFAAIAQALGGEATKIEALSVTESLYKKRDMSDFFNGASSGDSGSQSGPSGSGRTK
jgi:pilus assembly protein Flp/PilA